MVDQDFLQHMALAEARARYHGANVPASLENAAKDYMKATKRERRRARRTKPIDSLRSEPAVPSFLEQLAVIDLVNSVMQLLPAETRQALAMVYLEGKDRAEVADLLGISTDTLRRRMAEAAKKAADSIQDV